MFSKNYDKEILYLNKTVNDLYDKLIQQKQDINDLLKLINERFESHEKMIIELAKVNKSHKEAILKLGGK
jgi:hypothetical protein